MGLYQKLVSTQKDFLAIQKEHRKHNVQVENTKERRAFEQAQGEAYRFVCDGEKFSLNKKEKQHLLQFVLKVDALNINSDATSEINGCFMSKYVKSRKTYRALAKKKKLKKKLLSFVRENSSLLQGPVDYPKSAAKRR